MKKTRLIYLALAVLAGLQMVWWAILLYQQQLQIADLVNDAEAFTKADSYTRMIFVEFLFFISIWSAGIIYVYKVFNKELRLHEDKKTFLSLISHDLKTPLANIHMILETLNREGLDEDTKKKYLKRASNNVNRLNEQIEKILIYNELSKKRKQKSINLKNSIELVLVQFKKDSENYNIELEEVFINASHEEVESIAHNIMTNAVKYSSIDQSPQIDIKLYRRGKKVIFEVSDNGIGFSKNELKQAFEPFWRGETARKLAINGSGMGLNLVNELCKNTNAAIKISSSGVKQGTKIQIEWPQGKA